MSRVYSRSSRWGRSAALSSAATAAVLLAASQGWAQTTDASTGVQEIVVTAERRSENIQTVPLSVSAISGPQLQKLGVINFADYAVMVPSLSFGTGNDYDLSASRQVTIRGVAGTNTTSFYINDTPVPLSLDPRVLDLDRIEVLRGPQGTLFGASAMGGTVRYITKPSDTHANHGFIDAQAFDVNKGGAGYDVSGSYNIALVPDELSMKVSAFADYEPGIFTRIYGVATTPGYTVPASQPMGEQKHVGSDRQYGGMVTLTYTPRALPGLSITPMVIYQHDRTNGFPVADYSPDNLIQIRPLNVPQYYVDRWLFGSLTARYDAGFGSFVSSTAYFHRYTMDFEDSTEAVNVIYGSYANPPLGTTYQASPSPLYVPTNQITQEFRFESAFKGPLQFITGVFYNSVRNRRFSQQLEPYDGIGEPAFYENVPHYSQEVAAYLSATYKPTDAIEISAGVREAYLTYFTSYDAGGWMNGGISHSPSSHHETATTPRFTAKYLFDTQNMIYASAAKGYRVGGSTPQLAPVCAADLTARGFNPGQAVPYTSDSLWSYEVGLKNSWLDGKVRTRIAAYDIQWNNIQQQIMLPCLMHIMVNAGSAVSRGGELEADLFPFPGVSLNVSVGYDDAKITNAPAGSSFFKGQELNGVPKWNASVEGEYRVPTSFGSTFVRGQWSYVGESTSYNNDPAGIVRGAYSLIQLRVGAATGTWTGAVFVKNLLDKRANLGDIQLWSGELPGRNEFQIAQPRTIGVELTKSF